MKIEVEDISSVKKSMSVEVSRNEIDEERDKIVRVYARKAKLPGFRPGKAPLAIVRQRYDTQIQEELRDRVLSHYYQEAAKEKGFRPLSDPIVDEVQDSGDEPFKFKTTFEILPTFEVQKYKEIEVTRPSSKVADQEIDQALEQVRESRTTLETREGQAAVTGDILVATLHGEPEDGEPFDRENMMIEIGATENLPSFNEALEGLTAGAEKEFAVTYPQEYPAEQLAGKGVKFRIKVHEVKVKVLPDLDDEFAKDLGDFDDLVALKARIREDLEQRKKTEADSKVQQALLDKVLVENPIALPDVLVEQEIRYRLEEIVRRMMHQGMDPEQAGMDWKKMREQQEEGSRKSVHARLILDGVARQEGLSVDKSEVEHRIRHDAKRMSEKYEKVRANLEKQGGLEVLTNQLLREKSLDLLTSVANIRDEE